MAGIALDAGVVIGLYNNNDPHHRWAVDFMFQTTSKKLYISAVNYAEIGVAPVRAGLEKVFFSGISGLDIQVDPIESSETLELTKLRAETGLRMTDVCAIHVALKHAFPLATTDKAVATAARSLGIEVYEP